MKIKYIAALLVGIAGLGLQQAKADIFTFNLTSPNPAISPYPSPYVLVTVNRTSSTTATITFTSLTTGGFTYLMGDGGSVGVNVNGAFTASGLTGTGPTGFNGPQLSFAGAGSEDGFGSFNLTVNNFDGYTWSLNSISFNLTRTSGSWGSAQAVLTANERGALAAAHIFVAAGSHPDPDAGALATGCAAGNGGGPPPTVPDGGATVMLLGMALGALGMVRRYLIS